VARTERMKRGLCELLYSANEVNETKLTADGQANVDFWKAVAASFGWTVSEARKPTIDGTSRPRISDAIVHLIGAAPDSDVGDALFSQLSAVDHVTWTGLRTALELASAKRDDRAGTATVAMTILVRPRSRRVEGAPLQDRRLQRERAIRLQSGPARSVGRTRSSTVPRARSTHVAWHPLRPSSCCAQRGRSV
jgi:hypothetical protein